ncbi:unnamed protein product [Rhizophagus irregularis]|nr:unnamed protein product [Rhizophagus irregularis]
MLKRILNKETLQEIHMSLNNIDRLRYLVAKNLQKYLSFWTTYFRSLSKMYLVNNLTFIIISIKIAQLLQHLECFQIDYPSKRVKVIFNEFEINSYDDYHNLILSYCRIYTNVITAEGYYRLFITLFDVIKQLTGKPIQVKHIHW